MHLVHLTPEMSFPEAHLSVEVHSKLFLLEFATHFPDVAFDVAVAVLAAVLTAVVDVVATALEPAAVVDVVVLLFSAMRMQVGRCLVNSYSLGVVHFEDGASPETSHPSLPQHGFSAPRVCTMWVWFVQCL